MMDSMESTTVPPGFRFHPTDEELVGYYLRKKVASQKIDLDVIRDIDLYRIEPWDLQDKCRIGYEEQSEWYFFSHKDKKYPTGTRTNRATLAGFWKATGRDKAVYDKTRVVGMRKTLVFYEGRAPNGRKTDWIMHEYRLESDENGPPQEEGWVVCRAFKKRITGASGQTKTIERWESNYFYDEPSRASSSSVINPITEYAATHPPAHSLIAQNLTCKQETEAVNSSPSFHNNSHKSSTTYNNNESFVQLPELESPNSLRSAIDETRKVTADWRALDRFVASQLSQDRDRFDGDGAEPSFEGASYDRRGFDTTSFMLLRSSGIDGRDGEGIDDKLSVFLNSSSTSQEICDFGICIFEK